MFVALADLQRFEPALQHDFVLGEAFADHAELLGPVLHGVISDEVGHQEHALFGHQLGRSIIDQVAVLDGADAEARGAADGFGGIGVGTDVAAEGGRLFHRRTDLAIRELLAVERIVG
jgi:hypothetical protein